MPAQRSLSVMLWLVAIGFFMQTLDTTIVNTALPAMARSLNESPLKMQSVVVAYSLTMAIVIPASGWLADRFGTRQIFMAAIALFVIGSIGCSASQSLNQIVAARVVQGVGGAMLLPVGRLAILRTFPPADFVRALSFVAIPGLIGPLIGPVLGGWLVETLSWHWIFLINVPVGIIGCIATWLFMPDARTPVKRFDLNGYLLLAFGMAGLSLSLQNIAEHGLHHAAVLVLLIAALAAIVAYGLHATRAPAPLFSLALFRVHTYSVGLLGNLFARIGSGAMPYLIPLLLQVSLGYSPMQAGLIMLPAAAAGMGTKRAVPALIGRYGYRRVLIVNTVLVGIAMASFALMSGNEPTWVRVVQVAFFGAVNSLQFSAMNTITLKDLSGSAASSGNSLFSMVQMLSMSLGVTVAGTLLAGYGNLVPAGHGSLQVFHLTFASVGVITCASAWIFAQLGREVRRGRHDNDAGEI